MSFEETIREIVREELSPLLEACDLLHEPDRGITKTRAAEILGISLTKFRDLEREGRIPRAHPDTGRFSERLIRSYLVEQPKAGR